jgi:hypothetical protein
MTHVLKMPTLKRSPPMVLAIDIKPCDSLFQIVSEQATHGP